MADGTLRFTYMRSFFWDSGLSFTLRHKRRLIGMRRSTSNSRSRGEIMQSGSTNRKRPAQRRLLACATVLMTWTPKRYFLHTYPCAASISSAVFMAPSVAEPPAPPSAEKFCQLAKEDAASLSCVILSSRVFTSVG